MRLAGAHMKTLADHATVLHHHRTDARIRIGRVQAAPRELQRARHVIEIGRFDDAVRIHRHLELLLSKP
jgi:hypothetical protein